ncbi:hypothetical protein C8Q79DRAFT_1015174 [Trametes meyenii]|nr:hypothetical protein C8Q79DRAFT_1015174 [Trametes meyenii]
MRQTANWTDEEWQWLQEKLEEQAVVDLIQFAKTAKGSNKYGYAANAVCTAYRERFPHPRPAKTEEQWEARRKRPASKRASRQSGVACWPAETQSEYDARLDSMKTRVSAFLSQKYRVAPERANAKMSLATKPLPSVSLRREKQRSRGRLDVFQSSEEAPPRGNLTFGEWRAVCARAYAALDEESKINYMAIAREVNTANVPASEGGSDETDKPDQFSHSDVRKFIDEFGTTLHEKAKWGFLLCTGGLDEHGKPQAYVAMSPAPRPPSPPIDPSLLGAGEGSNVVLASSENRSKSTSVSQLHSFQDGHAHDVDDGMVPDVGSKPSAPTLLFSPIIHANLSQHDEPQHERPGRPDMNAHPAIAQESTTAVTDGQHDAEAPEDDSSYAAVFTEPRMASDQSSAIPTAGPAAGKKSKKIKTRASAFKGHSGVPMPSQDAPNLAAGRPRRNVTMNWNNQRRKVVSLVEKRALQAAAKRPREAEGETEEAASSLAPPEKRRKSAAKRKN